METRHSSWTAFSAYTLLGYLSLALHNWVLYPGRSDQGSELGTVLMLLNLIAGGICFWKGFQESMNWWRSLNGQSR
jgi:hypothetical protein